MPLEQKEPTKKLETRTADVMKGIRVLRGMPKYPEDKDVLEFMARMLATFIQTVEVNHTHPDEPDNPEWLGWVNPLIWVVEQVSQTCYAFPPPIRWRAIYEVKFSPLDGKSSADLQVIIED